MGESREPTRVSALPNTGPSPKVEADHRRSESRYRALINACAQILWTADADGHVQEDSQSWRQVTGQSLDEFLGDGWINAVHEGDRAQIQSAWAEAVGNKTLLESEYRLRTASGSFVHMLVRAAPVWEKEEVAGWVGLNIDITELRLAERERDALAARVEVTERIRQAALDVAGLLAQALTPEEVFRLCLQQLPLVLGVEGVLVLHQETPTSAGQIWATSAVPPHLGAQWRLAPAEASFPAAVAARTGERGSATFADAGRVDSVPLILDEQVIGAISVVP